MNLTGPPIQKCLWYLDDRAEAWFRPRDIRQPNMEHSGMHSNISVILSSGSIVCRNDI